MEKIILLVAVLMVSIVLISSQTDCHDAFSCAGLSISSGSIINCYGYFSCTNTTITTTTWTRCAGSYACYNTKSLRFIGAIITRGPECRGLYACASSDNIITNGDIQCHGELSCYDSKITITTSSGGEIECGGSRSCQSSIISGRDNTDHYLYGSLSALNATFMKYNGTDDIYYDFYGGYSGYNATILCNNTATCDITCWGNGCNGLTAQCIGGINTTTSDCQIVVDCDDAEKSDLCPNGTYIVVLFCFFFLLLLSIMLFSVI